MTVNNGPRTAHGHALTVSHKGKGCIAAGQQPWRPGWGQLELILVLAIQAATGFQIQQPQGRIDRLYIALVESRIIAVYQAGCPAQWQANLDVFH